MGVAGQHHALGALPPGNTRYPFYRRLGGPQGRSERVRKISPPPGFDPQTVQPRSESLYRLSYPCRQKVDRSFVNSLPAVLVPWYRIVKYKMFSISWRRELKRSTVSNLFNKTVRSTPISVMDLASSLEVLRLG